MRCPARAFALSVPVLTSLLAAAPAHAGPLNPPAGPIASTPKTLRSIEPRVEVNAQNTPGDASNSFIISQPGSYYLSGNVVAAGGRNGVRINAHHVTLDLNGFALLGNGSGGARGVTVGAFGGPRENIRIRNGSATNWNTGFDVSGTVNAVVEDASASGNVFDGFRGGSGTIFRNCNSVANGDHGFVTDGQALLTGCHAAGNADAGFQVAAASSLVACVSRGNQLQGFDIGPASTLEGCVADNNASDGFRLAEGCVLRGAVATANGAYGVSAGAGAVVTHSTSQANGFAGLSVITSTDNPALITHNVVDKNASNGIEAEGPATITDNLATANELSGIVVRSDTLIARNSVTGNGTRGTGNSAGIETFGDHNRVEENHATRNEFGLLIDGSQNLVVKNNACNNAIGDYLVFGGNLLGQLTNDPTNAGPWWNFACQDF